MYTAQTTKRMLKAYEVEAYTDKPVSELRKIGERTGIPFPDMHPELKRYDVVKIDEWLDITGGRKDDSIVDGEIMRRARGEGQDQVSSH